MDWWPADLQLIQPQRHRRDHQRGRLVGAGRPGPDASDVGYVSDGIRYWSGAVDEPVRPYHLRLGDFQL